MSNQYQLFIISLLVFLAAVGGVTFILGIIAGFSIKVSSQYRSRIAQNQGEASVRKTIVSNFQPPKFHLLNNITVPFQDGTTQVDHILISTKGIFVIETKSYSGWIFGDAKSPVWTQVIYRTKNKFQNPIRQNYKHVKAIQHLLDFLPEEQIHSIVVFTGSGKFKTPIPKGVVYQRELVEYISNFQEDVISRNRLEFCVGRLECRRYEITEETDLQHYAYLARKFGER